MKAFGRADRGYLCIRSEAFGFASPAKIIKFINRYYENIIEALGILKQRLIQLKDFIKEKIKKLWELMKEYPYIFLFILFTLGLWIETTQVVRFVI